MLARITVLLLTAVIVLGCSGVPSPSPSASVPAPAPTPAAVVKPNPSFDCAKATTATEKLICGSAAVSTLDRRLAAAWAPAVGRAPEPAALRTKEREWLAGNAVCTDEGCLSARYLERIGYLNGIAAAAEAGSASVTGHYQSENSQVAVLESGSGTIKFGLFAMGGGSAEWGPNMGTASGTASITDGVATWTVSDYGSPCSLTFHFEGQKMNLDQNGSDGACGFGMGVYAGGTYSRSDSRSPTNDELTNGF